MPPDPVKYIRVLVDSKTVIGEVGVNDISLSLVGYSPGKLSLPVSMWLSSDRFGSSVLSGTQVDDLSADGHFTIHGIRYSTDLSGHTCDEAKYICAQLVETPDGMEGARGLEASESPNESVLTGCAEIPKCQSNNLI